MLLAATFGTVLGLFLFSMVSIGILAASIAALASGDGNKEKIEPNSVLVVDIEQMIVERRHPSPFDEFEFEGVESNRSMELGQWLETIEAAKADSSIKGLYLTGSMFNGSLATLRVMRAALTSFKESGKFVVAYNEVYGQSAYYLSTAADEVYLFQEGMIELYGMSAELAFFKGTMDKLGISATVLKGPNNVYKSAVEPFYRTDMSAESEEQVQRLLDVAWADLCADMAVARGVSTDEINNWADSLTIRQPEDYVSLKLIDGLVYYDDLLTKLREKLGLEADEEVSLVEMDDYANSLDSEDEGDEKSWEKKDEIAVVYAVGAIGSGEGDSENIGSETLSEAIREAREDEDVKAIVMRVNSPGGSALASEVIWREAKLAAAEKPFIVSFGGVAASGGYYIATHADRIFASAHTITGSIGVFGIIPDARGLFTDKFGITFDGVKTNEHADFGSMARGMDEAELKLLNDYVGQTYREFVGKVAEGRSLDPAVVDSLARGRVWMGSDALANGLVDEIGDLDDAIAYAAEAAGMTDYELKQLPEAEDPFEEMLSEITSDAKVQTARWLFGPQADLMLRVRELEKIEGLQMRMMHEIKAP